uniref:Rubicon Homology domain-containing protein n=1 Tax=Cyprinus carpio TaxID=7962 RepID=A0A8C1YFN7_CYPCA
IYCIAGIEGTAEPHEESLKDVPFGSRVSVFPALFLRDSTEERCVSSLCSVDRVLDQFDTLPGHLSEDFHLFSLNDLTAVRSGGLAPKLRDLLLLGSSHVTDCVLCQAKGFICEFCGNDKDIIFPYELIKCLRCEGEPLIDWLID